MSPVAELEARLTGADGAEHLNDIQQLFAASESPDLAAVAEALQAIPRVLSHHRRRVGGNAVGNDVGADTVVIEWLQQHSEAYYSALVQLALSKDPRGQVCAIRLYMAALQNHDTESRTASLDSEGSAAGAARAAPERRIQHLLAELLLAERWSKHVVNCLATEFMATYIDVRHHVLTHIKVCLGQVGKVSSASDGALTAPPSKRLKQTAPFADLMRSRGLPLRDLFSRVFALLREVAEPVPAPSAENGGGEAGDIELLVSAGRPAGNFMRDYRRLFQETWLQLLSLRVPLDHCMPLLQLVPTRVMPHLSNPLMLADFYLRAFNSDSLEVSVMSLSGFFLLLTKHSLGDPETLSSSSSEFYGQLYSLIKPETFLLAQRARFQRLLAASLTSGLLPARFAAVFAKKCMCVAVAVADYGAVMWLVAVTYSLIQKHHSHCKYLLHQAPSNGSAAQPPSEEVPFSITDSLPVALTKVTHTSLWELKLLQRHHVPAVATLLQLFSKPFFKPSSRKLDPELFLDQSVENIYKQALKSGDRQSAKWKARGEACPLAFKVEDDALTLRLDGWAGALSTSQRRVGAGL